jgi:quercetin 2,3-dioxygenase
VFRLFLFLNAPVVITILRISPTMVWMTAMIEHRPYTSLPGVERAWLKARHHISYARSAKQSPDHWGALRAWNDDEIAPQGGFAAHAHANMEIITYVREGVVTHQDDLGNIGQTLAGQVQVMSAGTGIRHSEYNLEESVARIFQIWIAPDRNGGAPAWSTKQFPKSERTEGFVVLASGFQEDTDAPPIRAHARVVGATLSAGGKLEYATRVDRLSYLVACRGRLEVNGICLEERDGAAIKEERVITLTALRDIEVVLADVAA